MNPTNMEIISLIFLCVFAFVGAFKLIAISYEANKHLDGSFSTDWGRKK